MIDRVGIDITDDAMEDLRALPSRQLQLVALQWISLLKRNPQRGRELDWRWGQDLRQCRKLYFDATDRPFESDLVGRRRPEEGAVYRVVYRLLPSEAKPTVAQVFAIGRKYGSEGGVYSAAAERYRLILDAEENDD